VVDLDGDGHGWTAWGETEHGGATVEDGSISTVDASGEGGKFWLFWRRFEKET
jgi:hypothetical protein